MIDEVNAALVQALKAHLPEDAQVVVRLESCGGPEAGPVVEAVLTAVLEDPVAAAAQWVDVRDEDGRVVGRRPPPLHVRVRYLVTVRGSDPGADPLATEECRLVDAVLAACAGRSRVRAGLDPAGLGRSPHPVVLELSDPGPDAWHRFGNCPRTVLAVTVTASLDMPVDEELSRTPDRLGLSVGRLSAGRRADDARHGGGQEATPRPRRVWGAPESDGRRRLRQQTRTGKVTKDGGGGQAG